MVGGFDMTLSPWFEACSSVHASDRRPALCKDLLWLSQNQIVDLKPLLPQLHSRLRVKHRRTLGGTNHLYHNELRGASSCEGCSYEVALQQLHAMKLLRPNGQVEARPFSRGCRSSPLITDPIYLPAHHTASGLAPLCGRASDPPSERWSERENQWRSSIAT